VPSRPRAANGKIGYPDARGTGPAAIRPAAVRRASPGRDEPAETEGGAGPGQIEIDVEGLVVDWDEVAAAIFGQPTEAAIGLPIAKVLAEHGREAAAWGRRLLASGQPSAPLTLTHEHPDGGIRTTTLTTARRHRSGSTTIALIADAEQPATEEDETAALRAANRLRRKAQRQLREVTLLIDDDLVVERVLGPEPIDTPWQPWRVVGRPLLDVVHPDERDFAAATLRQVLTQPGAHPACVVRIRASDRAPMPWVEVRLDNQLHDPDVAAIVCHVVDVTEEVRLQRHLGDVSRVDPLTGLGTRATLALGASSDAVDETTEGPDGVAASDAAAVIVDIVDLDGINARLGYDAGDHVIRAIGDRLSGLAGPRDRIARLGGGRFVVVRSPAGEPRQLKTLARRILGVARAPISFGVHRVYVRCRIGSAVGVVGVDDVNDLVQRAGIALTMARLRGTDQIEIFGPDLVDEAVRRTRLMLGLRDLQHDAELELHYQPIVDMKSGVTVSREALLRWRHPTDGLIKPEAFIPIAESTGAIHDIGRWVLVRACTDAAGWTSETGAPVSVSVNVSTRQLTTTTFVADVTRALRRSGLPAERLVLEVTETTLVDNGETSAANLARLAALGVRVSLDDFGTGYASMSMLKRLPVHGLKIDRSFVSGLGVRGEDTAIVASIIELAHTLGTSVVAEGVETPLQRDVLQGLGCELGQGFLFGAPAPQRPSLDGD